MPTVGNTVAPSSFQEWFGLNSVNHVSRLITMPEAGTIESVSVFANGKDAGVSARCCVWGSGGALLAQSGLFTMPGQSFTLGAGQWHTHALNYAAAAGEQLFIGFARNPNGAAQWPYTGSGSHNHKTSSSWPTSLSGQSSHGGDIGAYATYSVGGAPGGGSVKVRRGGVWVDATGVFVRRSGVWVPASAVHVRRSGSW